MYLVGIVNKIRFEKCWNGVVHFNILLRGSHDVSPKTKTHRFNSAVLGLESQWQLPIWRSDWAVVWRERPKHGSVLTWLRLLALFPSVFLWWISSSKSGMLGFAFPALSSHLFICKRARRVFDKMLQWFCLNVCCENFKCSVIGVLAFVTDAYSVSTQFDGTRKMLLIPPLWPSADVA